MNTTEKKMAAAILRFEDDRVTGRPPCAFPAFLPLTRAASGKSAASATALNPPYSTASKPCLTPENRKKPGKAVFNIFWTIPPPSVPGLVLTPIRALSSSCRDHYFNSGSKNTGKILQRALNDHGAGIAVDGIPGKQTRQTLQTVLAESGERKLLDSLYERRESFYCSCRQFSTFGNGWRNRCKNAYEFAAALA